MMATVAMPRAAYEPEHLWTPAQACFPDSRPVNARRPAPLDLSASRRPRRAHSSPATTHFDLVRRVEPETLPLITEVHQKEQERNPPKSNLEEITVGLNFAAQLATKGENHLQKSHSERSSVISNASDCTTFSISSATSSTTSQSESSHDHAAPLTGSSSFTTSSLAAAVCADERLEIAKLSPFYIPNIKQGLASPPHSSRSPGHLSSPDARSIRSFRSVVSSVGSGPSTANTIRGLPNSPRPDPGQPMTSPRAESSRSTSPRPNSVKSLSSTRSGVSKVAASPSPNLRATFATSSSATSVYGGHDAAAALLQSSGSPTLSVSTLSANSMRSQRQREGKMPLSPPYLYKHTRSASSSKVSVDLNDGRHRMPGHIAEWDAVEQLLAKVRSQQHQLEELRSIQQPYRTTGSKLSTPQSISEHSQNLRGENLYPITDSLGRNESNLSRLPTNINSSLSSSTATTNNAEKSTSGLALGLDKVFRRRSSSSNRLPSISGFTFNLPRAMSKTPVPDNRPLRKDSYDWRATPTSQPIVYTERLPSTIMPATTAYLASSTSLCIPSANGSTAKFAAPQITDVGSQPHHIRRAASPAMALGNYRGPPREYLVDSIV